MKVHIAHLIIGMLSFRALEFCESDNVVKHIEIPIQGKKLFCKYHDMHEIMIIAIRLWSSLDRSIMLL